MDISGSDTDSIRLTIELLKEDLETLTGTSKGKHRQGEVPDSELAIEAYRSELESIKCLVADRCMCASIARAVTTDGNAIHQEQLVEDQAARDHRLALQLDSRRKATSSDNTEQATESKPQADEAEDELLLKLQALYVGCPDEDELDQAESSSWAANRPKPKTPQPTSVCTSCGDRHVFYDVARCPCKHEYCRACIASLFEASLRDESLFPPRCCKQPIPVEPNQVFLPPKLVGEFKAKKVELETPDRTYCHEPTCSTFVPVQFIKNGVASCVRCARTTCAFCKQASHQGDCPQDPAIQELLRVAAENGWQRCYSCTRLVELNVGCHHMSTFGFPILYICPMSVLIKTACLCGAHFCYLCGSRWKTCGCRRWDEHRLLARAQVVVDRDAGAILDVEGRARRIQEEANYLMENHECNHERWRGRGGRFDCEECLHTLPQFIYECRQCRIQVCRRCRFNRL